MAPFQALTDEDLADPATLHADARLAEVSNQTIQRPAGKGQPQRGGRSQSRRDDGTALLGRVGRRPTGAHVFLQPLQAARVEAVEPVANRVAAQVRPGGNLLRLQAAQGMDDNLGAPDQGRSKRVRACDPPNLRLLIIRHFQQSKSHGSAPKQIGMNLQQRRRSAIAAYLPDAPLRRCS